MTHHGSHDRLPLGHRAGGLRSVARRAAPALLMLAFLSSAGPVASNGQQREADVPPALTSYMGREIARTMHLTGADWLIRDEREREERCSLMLTNLGVKPGMTVCDMGCGNGFHALKLARMVGPQGQVLAVDIQPEMLELLKERAAGAELDNVKPVLGTVADPKLPEGKVDLILLVDVYHEFSHPERMLAGMRAALSPQGRIVLVEFRGEDPDVPIRPLHKMTKKQIMKELPANGFRLVGEFDRLPWQHMMFFASDQQDRDASAK